MNRFRDKTITDEDIIINSEFRVSLGPNLTLVNCSIINKHTARDISFIDTEMIGGIFHTKKRLTNWQQHRVTFEGVTFKGNFLGCDFGGRPDQEESSHYGLVKDCDFSQANMHLCRLFNADIESIKFGRWPYFTIINLEQAVAQIRKLDVPNALAISLDFSDEPEGTSAVLSNAELIAKKQGVDIEIIKGLVSQIDSVIM
ncbi:hypothetical protein [Psychrobacter sp. I-STPA10]|uniref:hypothetical protein n=1 Tax=Psychrobacter sp. I-STPA10 TaxID=2585769 RepID=UPI001E341676|nr:hypothetical protein [Psychrobacter sp. I-STPA10]